MTIKRWEICEWKPLPEHDEQPFIIPTQAIVHSIVGSARGAYNYFYNNTKLESHFILPKQGTPWQIMNLDRQADANYRANKRPDGTGAHSMETEDNGDPNHDPWTDSQIKWIIRWYNWEIAQFGIPRRVCRTPSDPGIGYHSLFGAPSDWTSSRGKTCPGYIRIQQWNDVIVPAVLNHRPQTETDIDEEGEQDMPQSMAWFRAKAGDNTGHCYRISGTTATWFSTHEEIQTAQYFGVQWAGGTEAKSMLDPVMWKSLAVLNGPLQNVYDRSLRTALLDDEAKILAAIKAAAASATSGNDPDKIAEATIRKLKESL